MPLPLLNVRLLTPRANKRAGFALLITITLVAFMVLVLVTVATLTRVETQVATNSQQLDHARQNALMALNIALGQLQKYVGPDQRVTTTADLVADKDKAGGDTPDPVFSSDSLRLTVQPGARHWTGVWGNDQTNIRYELRPNQIPPTTGNRRGVTPALLNWLVSGNESAAFTLKGARGGANPGTGITYGPDSVTNLSDLSAPTIDGDPAVLLVGPNTAGRAATSNEDYVAAPLVNITAPAGVTPGLGSAATPIVGRYAWWVGDEGVKARINLQNGYLKTGDAADQINSFIIAQRSGVEFMDGMGIPPESLPDSRPIYDFEAPGIPNLIIPDQLPLITTDSTKQTQLTHATQSHFHDITTTSFGVLSDTYAGGLKKDLTADIADTSDDFSYRPDDDDPIFTPISTVEQNIPNWKHIRSWARTNPNDEGLIDPTTTTARESGIFPIILNTNLGYNFYIDPSNDNLVVILFPLIVLHNPYSLPIQAADYEIGFRFSENAQLSFEIDDSGNGTYASIAKWHLDKAAITPEPLPEPPPFVGPQSFFRFKIRGQEIPPGERHIYLLPNSANDLIYDHAIPLVLERAPASAAIGTANRCILPGLTISHPNFKPDSYIRLTGNINANASAANQLTSLRWKQTSVVLTADEGLANPDWNSINSPTGRLHWHQAILDVFPLIREMIGSTFCATVAEGSLVSEKGYATQAWSSFRMMAPHEGHNWYSSAYHAGLVHNYNNRFIATANHRAPFIQATELENGSSRSLDRRVGAVIFGAKFSGNTRSDGGGPAGGPYPGFVNNLYTTGFGPEGVNTNTSTYSGRNFISTRYAILWDLLDSPDRLLSLGQLQHAPLARYGFKTSYPFANSYADLRISRNSTYRTGIVRPPSGTNAETDYDISWLLNRALWDRMFVSGVPSFWTQSDIDSGKPLPNARMTYYSQRGQTDLNKIQFTAENPTYDSAAANLMVAGSFNINSTSEQAWRAILAGTYMTPENDNYAAPGSTGDMVDSAIPYPRFSHNITALATTKGPYSGLPATMRSLGGGHQHHRDTRYVGNRGLYLNNPSLESNPSPEAVVAELARSIVNEIRRRGPFLSFSDFVNRPLTTSTVDDGIKGTLQAGIDNMRHDVAQVNPWRLSTIPGDAPKGLPGNIYPDWDKEHFLGGPASSDDMVTRGQRYRASWAMAPAYLTQADLLSTLAPHLSARSDTFTIRTYGEVNNPLNPDEITGKAWLEAVVQRIPDYIDDSIPAEANLNNLPNSTAKTANLGFGRKFKIVSFRWLSSTDI